MDIIGFKDLYYRDFNISNYVAINKMVENNRILSVFNDNRTTSVLVYLKDCNIKYIFENGEELFAKAGSVIYIPHNVKYYVNYQSVTMAYSMAQLVAFELHDADNKQFILSDKIVMVCENGSYSEIFDEIVKISNEDIFPHTKFKTLFYSLISEISRKYIYDKIYTRELSNIAPTIEYMRSNPLTNMSLPELAEISHISESCFRRLFKKHFNMTPVEYIKEKKINKAKSLIRSNMYAINEVSQLVGYEAPSYFSKVFKKTTGMSPGEYRDRFRL